MVKFGLTSSKELPPALSEISRGKGLGYIPAAVDGTSANMDRISKFNVMCKAQNNSALCDDKWDIA